MVRLLILGGTAEAIELAEMASARGHHVVSSLAGRTRAPRQPPGEVAVGGFGGAAGLLEFLRSRAIERVIDASHPFAAQISRHALGACQAAGVARLRLLRPPWRPVPGDRWCEVADAATAATLLPGLGRRGFLTLGHRDLAAFAGLDDAWFLVRTIELPAELPLARATWIGGRGPFDLAGERALLEAHRIEVLITKASGGAATYAKLEAARLLQLPVLMLRRPPPPPGPRVATVADALAWLEAE